MILELDTSLLKKFNISINQLVFINLVLSENQNNHQDVHELLSRVSDEEIQDLIQRNIIVETITDDNKIYRASEQLAEVTKSDKESMFDEFYEVFPVYVIRPDGTKGFLRANVNKCRKEYNKIIGKSRAMHDYLLGCLKWEIDNKVTSGKLGYKDDVEMAHSTRVGVLRRGNATITTSKGGPVWNKNPLILYHSSLFLK